MEPAINRNSEFSLAGRAATRQQNTARIASLRQERADLEEEVRQVRVSVAVYPEIVRRPFASPVRAHSARIQAA